MYVQAAANGMRRRHDPIECGTRQNRANDDADDTGLAVSSITVVANPLTRLSPVPDSHRRRRRNGITESQ